MYKRWSLQCISRYQLECRDFGLQAFILAYDNISNIMINQEVLAEYSQVAILLGGQ
jgi:hypothetical protein